MSDGKILSSDNETKKFQVDVIDASITDENAMTPEDVEKFNIPLNSIKLDGVIPTEDYTDKYRCRYYREKEDQLQKQITQEGMTDVLNFFSTLPLSAFNNENFIKLFEQLVTADRVTRIGTAYMGQNLIHPEKTKGYQSNDQVVNEQYLNINGNGDGVVKTFQLLDWIERFRTIDLTEKAPADYIRWHDGGFDIKVDRWLLDFADDDQNAPAYYEQKRRGKWTDVPYAMFTHVVAALKANRKACFVQEAICTLLASIIDVFEDVDFSYDTSVDEGQQPHLWYISGQLMREHPRFCETLLSNTPDENVLVFPDQLEEDVYMRLIYVMNYIMCLHRRDLVVLFPNFQGMLETGRVRVVTANEYVPSDIIKHFVGGRFHWFATFLKLYSLDNPTLPAPCGNIGDDKVMCGSVSLRGTRIVPAQSNVAYGYLTAGRNGLPGWISSIAQVVDTLFELPGVAALGVAIVDAVVTTDDKMHIEPWFKRFRPVRCNKIVLNVQDYISAVDYFALAFCFDRFKNQHYNVTSCYQNWTLQVGGVDSFIDTFKLMVPTSSKWIRMGMYINGIYYVNPVVEIIPPYRGDKMTGLYQAAFWRAYFRHMINRIFISEVWGSLVNKQLINNPRIYWIKEVTPFVGSLMLIPAGGRRSKYTKYTVFDTQVYSHEWCTWDEDPANLAGWPANTSVNFNTDVNNRHAAPASQIEACELFIPEIDWLKEVFGPLPKLAIRKPTNRDVLFTVTPGEHIYGYYSTASPKIYWQLRDKHVNGYSNGTVVKFTTHRSYNGIIQACVPFAVMLIDPEARIECQDLWDYKTSVNIGVGNLQYKDAQVFPNYTEYSWPLRWFRLGIRNEKQDYKVDYVAKLPPRYTFRRESDSTRDNDQNKTQ